VQAARQSEAVLVRIELTGGYLKQCARPRPHRYCEASAT